MKNKKLFIIIIIGIILVSTLIFAQEDKIPGPAEIPPEPPSVFILIFYWAIIIALIILIILLITFKKNIILICALIGGFYALVPLLAALYDQNHQFIMLMLLPFYPLSITFMILIFLLEYLKSTLTTLIEVTKISYFFKEGVFEIFLGVMNVILWTLIGAIFGGLIKNTERDNKDIIRN